ncbi:MAG: rhamnogalacturonan acetylesterase, partial [Lentisphaeraceae bacterium]|nr:rhamnogalacturonan acetylesterase [Lentisphaeraceae bacterium]
GGRSSKSWLAEKRLPKALASKPDYVFIQFGHNGQPGKGPARETIPATTYKDYLKIYIKEFKAIGAQPVIFSSVTRRKFAENGKINSSLTPWAQAAKEVAEEEGLPFIDLHSISIAYHNEIGREASMKFNPKSSDITHFNKVGGEIIARLIAKELGHELPEVAAYLK